MSRPPNLNKKVKRVQHSELTRDSSESIYRSECPVCKEGVLLVKRDSKTGLLLAEDMCISCGQRFIYTDIDEMRKREGS